jgi:hypothetical protein
MAGILAGGGTDYHNMILRYAWRKETLAFFITITTIGCCFKRTLHMSTKWTT